MNVLYPLDHLVREDQDCFEGEFAAAEVEEVFQRRPEQVHHHDIVLTFRRAVVDVGDALVDDRGVLEEVLVELALIEELRVLGADRLELNSHLHVGF